MREVQIDELVTLYRKALDDRNEELQTVVIEAVQQVSVAEGARAFADEATTLDATGALTSETIAATAVSAEAMEAAHTLASFVQKVTS